MTEILFILLQITVPPLTFNQIQRIWTLAITLHPPPASPPKSSHLLVAQKNPIQLQYFSSASVVGLLDLILPVVFLIPALATATPTTPPASPSPPSIQAPSHDHRHGEFPIPALLRGRRPQRWAPALATRSLDSWVRPARPGC
jgi:hypothetical protein